MKENNTKLNTVESLEQIENKLVKLKGNLKLLKDKAKELANQK